MAENEAARRTGEPIVVSDSPDVCITPPGVPVPYSIVSYFPSSTSIANTVLFTEDPAFTVASSIPGVIGDEAGSGGGVVSGSFAGGGWVHVVQGSHTPNVLAENELVVFHSSKMEMNCGSPLGPGNTIGSVLWQSTTRGVWVDPEGNLHGDTDPEDRPENERELDQKLEAENPGAKTEWELAGSHSEKRGLNAGPFKSSSASTEIGIERSSTVEGNLAQFGGEDANIQLGHGEAGTKLGVSRSSEGYEATAEAHAGFKGIAGHGQLGGERANLQVDAEALSAQASAEGKASFGPEGAGVSAKLGAEAILARASAKGEVTVTTQDVLDASLNRWFGTSWKLPEAIGGTGIVISGQVEGTVGAKAEAKVEATVNEHEIKLGAGLGAALGLGAGLKGSVGLKLGDGLVDGAVKWVKSWF